MNVKPVRPWRRPHRFVLIGLAGVGAALSAQLPAASAVTATVGQIFTADAVNSCVPTGPLNNTVEIFQTAREDGTSYVVPNDGVITSWSFHGSPVQGSQVTLRVFRPEAAGTDRFVPVGDGGDVTAFDGDQDFTTPARLSVKAGDIVGLRAEFGACAAVGSGADTYRSLSSSQGTPVGTGASYTETRGLEIDVSAKVEPDLDGDGFGDETQDACPRLASTQAPCPVPNTRITHKPASPTHNRTARFRFTSTVAGATFQCRLDANLPFRCTSPFTVKVKPGRHTFHVAARANQAIDATAATAHWRLLR